MDTQQRHCGRLHCAGHCHGAIAVCNYSVATTACGMVPQGSSMNRQQIICAEAARRPASSTDHALTYTPPRYITPTTRYQCVVGGRSGAIHTHLTHTPHWSITSFSTTPSLRVRAGQAACAGHDSHRSAGHPSARKLRSTTNQPQLSLQRSLPSAAAPATGTHFITSTASTLSVCSTQRASCMWQPPQTASRPGAQIQPCAMPLATPPSTPSMPTARL